MPPPAGGDAAAAPEMATAAAPAGPAPSAPPVDPFAALSDDPFLAAAAQAPPPAPPAALEDDPFARARFDDEPSAGNSAVASAAIQAPAPGVAQAAPPPFAPQPEPSLAPPAPPPPDLGALSLEDSDRRAGPVSSAPFEHDAAPPPAPGPLDFGAFDFGEGADAPFPPPAEPAAQPAPSAPAAAAADGGVDPLAGLSMDDLERSRPAPAPEAAPPHEPTPAAPVAAAAPAPDARLAERSARRGPRLGALGVNALSLAALVVVAAAMFTSWRGRPGAAFSGGATAPLAARATSSGLYGTAAGPPVLVVRGEVRSRASAPVAARVQVELVDGGRVVARGTAVPGAVPTPEDAWAVDGAAGAERLAAALAARAPARLAPGESAPFGAVLAELPPGAERLTVRVSAAPAAP